MYDNSQNKMHRKHLYVGRARNNNNKMIENRNDHNDDRTQTANTVDHQ